jgi:hypothetical protein
MQRAAKPRIPQPTATQLAEQKEHAVYLRGRTLLESRSMARGLMLLALLVLVAGFLRAGFPRVFPHGWWRP